MDKNGDDSLGPFLKRHPLINKKIRSISNIDLDLSELRKQLHQQFLSLYDLATQTDPSFLGAVQAQEVKQIKGINALEKRLLLAQKRSFKTRLLDCHSSMKPFFLLSLYKNDSRTSPNFMWPMAPNYSKSYLTI